MTESAIPAHRELVDDLRTLRTRGLVRLRRLPLRALWKAAAVVRPDAPGSPRAIEELIRTAAERLDEGKLTKAAVYTLGLAPGTRDWPAQDRRRRAAEVYGVTPEHFRKTQEWVVLEQLAEQILALCTEHTAQPELSLPEAPPRTSVPLGVLQPTVELALPGTTGPPIVLHVGPIELLEDLDVLVSSENVYLEMSKTFASSVSASIRRAGAYTTPTGEILQDVIQEELWGWLAKQGRAGLPVPPGTVIDTPPGRLAENGIKRIYHAAVVTPRPGSRSYDIVPGVIPHAVHNIFRLAERQHDNNGSPLKSICFPLFGAGHGGLTPEMSIAYLWRAIAKELNVRHDWHVHIVTSNVDHAEAVLGRV